MNLFKNSNNKLIIKIAIKNNKNVNINIFNENLLKKTWKSGVIIIFFFSNLFI